MSMQGKLPLRRRPVRDRRAVRQRLAVPLHELQADLGRRRHDERAHADGSGPDSGRRRAVAPVHARGGLSEDVLLRLRLEPVRWGVARVGDVQRPAQRDRLGLRRRTGGAHLRPLRRTLGNVARRRASTVRDPRHVTQRIFPMIAYEDTAAAIDWLTRAFGFEEHGQRYVMEDGTIGHAELEIGGERVMLATPNREYQSPRRHPRAARPHVAGSTTPG